MVGKQVAMEESTMTIEEKIEGISYCLKTKSWEDAAVGLCDLLDFCRKSSISYDGRIFANLGSFVAYYGKDPNSNLESFVGYYGKDSKESEIA